MNKCMKRYSNQSIGKWNLKHSEMLFSYLQGWLMGWQGCRLTGSLILDDKSAKQYNFGEMVGRFLFILFLKAFWIFLWIIGYFHHFLFSL